MQRSLARSYPVTQPRLTRSTLESHPRREGTNLMKLTKRLGAAFAATALLLAGLAIAPAEAGGATGIWKNCTALNKKYPHGVGKAHAHDQTSGTPVKSFKHSNKLYKRAMNHNAGLDRDKDKIACEKA